MSRNALILIFAILLSGCSVLRKSRTTINNNDKSYCVIENIKENNLSNGDFNIVKAEIKINANGEDQKLLANIKFKLPGSYMVSLRSIAGIEALRAFINDDTILINDRIHKKLYEGSSKYISEKYGIKFSEIPVILGDLIDEKNNDRDTVYCTKGSGYLFGTEGTSEIKYIINCGERKTMNAEIKENDKHGSYMFSYGKIYNNENKHYPERIEIEENSKGIIIEIKIIKAEFKNIENLNFIPGRDYEKVIIK